MNLLLNEEKVDGTVKTWCKHLDGIIVICMLLLINGKILGFKDFFFIIENGVEENLTSFTIKFNIKAGLCSVLWLVRSKEFQITGQIKLSAFFWKKNLQEELD